MRGMRFKLAIALILLATIAGFQVLVALKLIEASAEFWQYMFMVGGGLLTLANNLDGDSNAQSPPKPAGGDGNGDDFLRRDSA